MKSWVKVILIVIAIIVVFFVGFIACGLGTLGVVANSVNDTIEEAETNGTIKKIDNSGVETEISETSESNGVVNVKVGDTVEFETFKMTIVDSERAVEFKYADVPEGYEIVRVGFEIENIGAEEHYFYADFEAYCDGIKCEDYWGGDDYLYGGDLGAGRKMKGSMYYYVPTDAMFEIEYHPSVWNDNYIIIEVQ